MLALVESENMLANIACLAAGGVRARAALLTASGRQP